MIRPTTRERLLAAAARVLAQSGFAGTTTRRVAEEAGLNEVTLFRQFGTKERLLAEAVRLHGVAPSAVSLPAEPAEPEAELAAWCSAHIQRLGRAPVLLRRCLGEPDQLPAVDIHAEAGLDLAADELRAWVKALRAGGWVDPEAPIDGPIAMLISSLLVDALARDDFPGVFAAPRGEAGLVYAAGFLAALGAGRPPE